jgi:hypothetical protein
MSVKAGFARGGLDTRPAVIEAYLRQDLDPRVGDALTAFLTAEDSVSHLRDEFQPKAIDAALRETAEAILPARQTIRAEALAEHSRVQRESDAALARTDGAHATTAGQVNLVRLRESVDVTEMRALLNSARRAGPVALAEAVAIAKPRLQKLAADSTGISRTVAGSPQLTSGWFALLCELPHLGATDAQSQLAAVDRRRDERLRLVMAACAAVHPRLPQIIVELEATAERPQVDGPKPTMVFGRFWENK